MSYRPTTRLPHHSSSRLSPLRGGLLIDVGLFGTGKEQFETTSLDGLAQGCVVPRPLRLYHSIFSFGSPLVVSLRRRPEFIGERRLCHRLHFMGAFLFILGHSLANIILNLLLLLIAVRSSLSWLDEEPTLHRTWACPPQAILNPLLGWLEGETVWMRKTGGQHLEMYYTRGRGAFRGVHIIVGLLTE